MKSIKVTKRDRFGCGRTFAIRPCGSGVSLAETDPDFDFESFRGVFDSETAALDRIEMPTQSI